jgi:hypothetical protein
VYDEKALLEMTLYGLPFINVQVPNPTRAAELSQGGSEPQAQPRPVATPSANGVFTRVITMENAIALESAGRGSVARAQSQVQDTFVPSSLTTPIALSSRDQLSAGRPVLPLLDYDITVESSNGAGDPTRPLVRGIRLLEARSDTLLDGFAPHVTNIVTDEIYAQQQQLPSLTPLIGDWLPEQPYNYIQVGGIDDQAAHEMLLVSPVQFRPTSASAGQIRRFTRMVFEISYVDPLQAPPATLQDTTPPFITQPRIEYVGLTQQSRAAAPVRFSASVTDSAPGSLEVTLTYSLDGATWTRLPMTFNAASGRFEAQVSLPDSAQSIVAIIEARDANGNVSSKIARNLKLASRILYLPLVVR